MALHRLGGYFGLPIVRDSGGQLTRYTRQFSTSYIDGSFRLYSFDLDDLAVGGRSAANTDITYTTHTHTYIPTVGATYRVYPGPDYSGACVYDEANRVIHCVYTHYQTNLGVAVRIVYVPFDIDTQTFGSVEIVEATKGYLQPSAISLDPVTGDLFVVSTYDSGGPRLAVWRKPSGGSWASPSVYTGATSFSTTSPFAIVYAYDGELEISVRGSTSSNTVTTTWSVSGGWYGSHSTSHLLSQYAVYDDASGKQIEPNSKTNALNSTTGAMVLRDFPLGSFTGSATDITRTFTVPVGGVWSPNASAAFETTLGEIVVDMPYDPTGAGGSSPVECTWRRFVYDTSTADFDGGTDQYHFDPWEDIPYPSMTWVDGLIVHGFTQRDPASFGAEVHFALSAGPNTLSAAITSPSSTVASAIDHGQAYTRSISSAIASTSSQAEGAIVQSPFLYAWATSTNSTASGTLKTKYNISADLTSTSSRARALMERERLREISTTITSTSSEASGVSVRRGRWFAYASTSSVTLPRQIGRFDALSETGESLPLVRMTLRTSALEESAELVFAELVNRPTSITIAISGAFVAEVANLQFNGLRVSGDIGRGTYGKRFTRDAGLVSFERIDYDMTKTTRIAIDTNIESGCYYDSRMVDSATHYAGPDQTFTEVVTHA